jgi:hypothetical protein
VEKLAKVFTKGYEWVNCNCSKNPDCERCHGYGQFQRKLRNKTEKK